MKYSCPIHDLHFIDHVGDIPPKCPKCIEERESVERIVLRNSIASQIMDVWEDRGLVERTWNTAYPDRRPWSEIGQEAQAEWRRVFAIYDSLKAPRTEIIDTRKP